MEGNNMWKKKKTIPERAAKWKGHTNNNIKNNNDDNVSRNIIS